MNRYGTCLWGAKRYFQGGPQTASELFDMPAWERPVPFASGGLGYIGGSGGIPGGAWPGDLPPIAAPVSPPASWEGLISLGVDDGSGMDGGFVAPGTVGGGGGGGDGASLITVTPERTELYQIEIRDEDGDKVEKVTSWFKGDLDLTVDEASELTFTVVGDSAHVANLVPPNSIWLRDRWGMVIDTFRMQRPKKVRDGDAIYYTVMCQGAIVQLAHEPVIEYDSEATIKEHIIALLALQVQGDVIQIGKIDRTIGNETVRLSMRLGSVLGALRELQSYLPSVTAGHFFVTARRKLDWRVSAGNPRNETLEVGKHLQGLSYDEDWEQLVTRVYLYGRGLDKYHHVKLTDEGADQANEYIEDATGVSIYGVRALWLKDNRVKYPETLLLMAQRILAEGATPPVEISIRAIDLSKADGVRWSGINDLYIGAEYQVLDSAQSIDSTVKIVSLKYSLDNPLPVSIGLKNKRRHIGDFIEALYNQMAALDVDYMDDGKRYPYMGRAFPDGFDSSPFGDLKYKDLDWRYNSGEAEWYKAADGSWNQVTRLYGSLPEDVGAAAVVGDSVLGSPGNHVHDGVQIGDIPVVGSGIQSVGGANVAGSSGDWADAEHGHLGIKWLGNLGAFPGLPEDSPAIFFHTGTFQLWLGYKGPSPEIEVWTPMQQTTIIIGTPA